MVWKTVPAYSHQEYSISETQIFTELQDQASTTSSRNTKKDVVGDIKKML
jgi:hypothetical protein